MVSTHKHLNNKKGTNLCDNPIYIDVDLEIHKCTTLKYADDIRKYCCFQSDMQISNSTFS